MNQFFVGNGCSFTEGNSAKIVFTSLLKRKSLKGKKHNFFLCNVHVKSFSERTYKG